MNIFRSLIGKVWQDPNAAEVVKISNGQLFIVRPGNIRSPVECIYNEGMATIRRVASIEHNFQLVITRVYEDGDQDLIEDEDETDEEKVFLVSEELEFRIGESEGEPCFIWRDLDGDVDEFYEFIAPGTNQPTRDFFVDCMYRAMFERKYKMSADTASDADFAQFIWQPPAPKAKRRSTPKRKPSLGEEDTSLPSAAVAEPPLSLIRDTVPAAAASAASEPALAKHEAELYIWDVEEEEFVNQGIVSASIVQQGGGGYHYWLIASNDDRQLIGHKITQEMNQKFTDKMLSLTWNHLGDDGSRSSWLFRFNDADAYGDYLHVFGQCLWETIYQTPFSKNKPEEQTYIINSNHDVEMPDVENDEDDEDQVMTELDPDEEQSESESEEEYDEEEGDAIPPLSTDRNSQLTVGYKGDRSFVVRGSSIGVFSHTNDSIQPKYHATITNIATPDGQVFKPKHVMLHDQDSKMILMNPTDRNSLFSMDIESGKVVEEWKVHDDIQVDHIAPENKFAQMSREQTIVGASHNALFRIDPRVSGTKMVESQYKQYVSKNKFSGVATTSSGKLAVASEKGDIRLFDSIGKNAKTALPPLGDPITGLDVTGDGRYIVATTKTYLLLIDTLIGEGRYEGQLGFDRSFPASAKPIPRRLQLKSEHVAYMNHDITFTPARFNQGANQTENAIVTSTGQFVIAWDFAKVKKGQLERYEIKKYEDHVVQDNFKFGDDKEIIVALQNNVLAINKKNLKKPTRHSISVPVGNLRSNSAIVNAPY